jgi:hypothetical protein
VLADFANCTPAPDKHYLVTFLSQMVLALSASINRNKVFEHFFKIRRMVQKFKSQQ